MKPLARHCTLIGCVLLTFVTSCKPKPAAEPSLALDTHSVRDPHTLWADSVMRLLTPEERLGQLFLLDAPKVVTPATLGSIASTTEKVHAGMVRVHLHTQEDVNLLRFEVATRSKVPVMIAQQMDSAFHDAAGYPQLPTLGRMPADSGWALTGRHMAADANLRGVQLLLSEAGTVSPATEPHNTHAQGSDAVTVSAQLHSFLDATAQGRVAVATSPLPAVDFAFAEVLDIVVRHLRPMRDAMGHPAMAVQTSHALIPAIDSVRSLSFSRKALEVGLREGLHYEGLIFSADLSEHAPSPESAYSEPEQDPAVRALLAGCDVLVNPPDAFESYRNIQHLLRAGMIPQSLIDEKARRILWMKSWTRLAESKPMHPDSTLVNEQETQHEVAVRRMVEQTLTLAANRNDMLPLKLAETRKVATLVVGAGNSQHNPFQQAFDLHFTASHHSLSAQVDSTTFSSQLNVLLKAHDDVVVAILPNLAKGAGEFPSWLKRSLLANRHRRMAVVTFAGERSMQGLDSLDCILVADGTHPRVQELAAQAVLGSIRLQGALAYGIGTLRAGDGVKTSEPIRLKYTLPEDAGFPSESLLRLDSILYEALRIEAFPGCQVFVAKSNKVVYHRAFGFHSYDRVQRVTTNDIYDVASVTKAAATTLMMMYAADRDSHLLNATLKEYVTDLDSTPNLLRDITIDDLLVHQSGLPPAPPIDTFFRIMRNPALREVVYSRSPDSLHQVQLGSNLYLNEVWLDTLWSHCKRFTMPGPRGEYLYSDYNFFLLMKVLERKYNRRLDSLVYDSIYAPLGLTHTGYLPLHRFTPEEVVPTETDNGWRLETLDGFVHDETAALTGCVGGNAGLFSTSRELGILLQTLLNNGSYGGRQLFSPGIVRKFTSRSPHCHRALGWDMQTHEVKNVMVCESATPACFGHIGYTGTAIWADPTHELVFVFLSNRVHPTRKNWKINEFKIRQSLQQAVYEAFGLYPPDPSCENPSYLESNLAENNGGN